MKKLKVALIQMTCGKEVVKNVERAVRNIETAAAAGAQVVCLQEVFQIQYPCQSEDHAGFALAEPLDGETVTAVRDACQRLEVVAVVPIFERRAPGVYHNSAVVIDADGSTAGVYRKMHIPDDPLYYEKFYFAPGDLGFLAFQTRYAKIGVCICWDQWYPEAARLTAMQGADLLVYPTAIGWIPDEKESYGAAQVSAWQTMMRSHSIANGVFVAAPNRVGREDEIEFWGHSFVSDPYGKMMAESPDDAEDILYADCDLSLIETARTHWPFFRDRRIDAYDGLTKRWGES